MLARNGEEALHGMCMPNHGRSRIKAVALHAWHNQDAPHQPLQLPMTIRSRTRDADDGISARGEKNEERNTTYFARPT